MVRTGVSWLAIGGVAVIFVVAAVDAFRSSESKTPPPKDGLVRDGQREETREGYVPLTSVPETEPAPLKRCTVQQLALRVERLGGTHLLALAHVWGSPCRTARIPIEVSLFYRKGIPVNPDTASISVWSQAFAPSTLSPGVEAVAELHVSYEMRRAEAEAVARRGEAVCRTEVAAAGLRRLC